MRCVYHDGSFHIRVKFCTFTYYWTKKWCWFTPRIMEPVRVVEILELSKCRNQGNRFYPQFAFYPRSAVCVLHWPCKLSISSAKYLLYCWVRCLSTLKLWNYPFLVHLCVYTREAYKGKYSVFIIYTVISIISCSVSRLQLTCSNASVRCFMRHNSIKF